MRLAPNSALAVWLCVWIPVALTYGSGWMAPEDQDGSGDDELSGSGSGDDDIWMVDPEGTTQPSSNTTNIVWYTDGPFLQLEHTVTPVVHLDPEPETSLQTTKVPLPTTTQVNETQPSTVNIKSFGSKEDQKEETTTTRDVVHPETTTTRDVVHPETTTTRDVVHPETTTTRDVVQPETTLHPVEKLPVVPTVQEVQTTIPHVEKNVSESSVVDQKKDEDGGLIEVVSLKTNPRDGDAPTVLLSTTSASHIQDPESSGDAVEATTVQGIHDNFVERIVPVEHVPNEKTMVDNDFVFVNNQTPETKEKSNFSRGNSGNDSIMEKKEVLAGVIACGVVGLAFAILLVSLMVYRMKKKDEGSYSLDEHKHPNGGYQKPQKQEEFLA